MSVFFCALKTVTNTNFEYVIWSILCLDAQDYLLIIQIEINMRTPICSFNFVAKLIQLVLIGNKSSLYT